MKRMSKIAVVLLSLCMALTTMLFMVSCKPDEPTNEPCKTHVDANEDGKCDVCGAEVEVETCDDHIDTDGDNLCEICGAVDDVFTLEPDEAIPPIRDCRGFTITRKTVLYYGLCPECAKDEA